MTRPWWQFWRADTAPAADDDYWYSTQTGSGVAQSGALVTADSAMRVAAVYACVRVLATSVAMLPVVVYREAQGRDVPATDVPLYKLLRHRPNGWQTGFDFRLMMTLHLALRGNAYAEKVIAPNGDISDLIPLHPDRVRVYRQKDLSLIYDVRDPLTGTTKRLLQDDVFHIRGMSSDGIVGLSPIAIAREVFGGALAAQDYGNRLFANDARPGGLLSIKGRLSPESAKRLKQQWQENFSGSNVHKTAVLEEGTSWQQVGMTNADLQFLDSRKFSVEEIARIFGVPPHKIGELTRSTNNNIEHQGIDFVTSSLMPYLIAWETAIERDLMVGGERDELEVSFVEDALLRGDMPSRYSAYAIGRQWGWLSANDIRARERMAPIEGGDEYLRPLNMVDATAPAETPAPAPPAPQDDESSDDPQEGNS